MSLYERKEVIVSREETMRTFFRVNTASRTEFCVEGISQDAMGIVEVILSEITNQRYWERKLCGAGLMSMPSSTRYIMSKGQLTPEEIRLTAIQFQKLLEELADVVRTYELKMVSVEKPIFT